MNDETLMSVAQLREFTKLSRSAVFKSASKEEAYAWVEETLIKFRYFRETKKNKGVIKGYIRTMTGYSDTQVNRLISRKKHIGVIKRKERTQNTFETFYTREDVALLAEVDNAEGRRNGKAVRKTCKDMYLVFGDVRFERLAHISSSHIYNLREKEVYKTKSLTYTKTQPTTVNIGIRKKPEPEGKPGYIRVDSVHQGDLDKEKGVYHINMVDEVTQEEVVATVEGISEYFLIPALLDALAQFKVNIVNFHSDNGSEYINKRVAELLEKLRIAQTKSRARQSGDQGLVEGKNRAVPRKQYGHAHIPKKYAPMINEYNKMFLNPYLFFHRQCAFADDVMDERGKIKKVYNTYLTPCEKLLSIENVEQYLKNGVTKESLVAESHEQTHLVAAQEMQKAKQQLFAKIRAGMVQ